MKMNKLSYATKISLLLLILTILTGCPKDSYFVIYNNSGSDFSLITSNKSYIISTGHEIIVGSGAGEYADVESEELDYVGVNYKYPLLRIEHDEKTVVYRFDLRSFTADNYVKNNTYRPSFIYKAPNLVGADVITFQLEEDGNLYFVNSGISFPIAGNPPMIKLPVMPDSILQRLGLLEETKIQ